LAFDFRGFGASEGRPRAVVNVDRQLDDWAAALAYARAREDVDPELVGAWGSSFTGGHVFAVAARDHRLAGAVAQVPYCDGFALARAAGIWRNLRLLPAVVRDLLRAATGGEPYLIDALGPPRARAVINARFPELADQILSQVPSSANKTAARSLLELYRFRPLDHVAEIRCPLLVVLSYEDHVAPPDSAMQLAVRSPFVELAMFHARHFDLYTGDTRERALRTELTFMTHHLDRLRAPAPALASV
jgi:pimeloyl-ACP methyl ester carboxylesterase